MRQERTVQATILTKAGLRSTSQLCDRVTAEEPFFGERPVAVVHRHFGGLVGLSQPNGLGDRVLTTGKSDARVIFSLLCHCPTLVARVNTIYVASQHHRFPCI